MCIRDRLTHPRFRAAYDFVLLREQSGEDLGGIGEYWTKRQEVEPAVPRTDTNDYSSRPDGRKRRRRGPRKPRSSAE